MEQRKRMNYMGWEGIEPSTSGLKVSHPFYTPLISKVVSTWSVNRPARNTDGARRFRAVPVDSVLARHGSLEIVVVLHRGKPTLRYRSLSESVTKRYKNGYKKQPENGQGYK